MTTYFEQLDALESGASRPRGYANAKVRTLGIVGAGQLGASLALLAAKAGIEVVLKDLTLQRAEHGRAYSERACTGCRLTDDSQAAAILGREGGARYPAREDMKKSCVGVSATPPIIAWSSLRQSRRSKH